MRLTLLLGNRCHNAYAVYAASSALLKLVNARTAPGRDFQRTHERRSALGLTPGGNPRKLSGSYTSACGGGFFICTSVIQIVHLARCTAAYAVHKA